MDSFCFSLGMNLAPVMGVGRVEFSICRVSLHVSFSGPGLSHSQAERLPGIPMSMRSYLKRETQGAENCSLSLLLFEKRVAYQIERNGVRLTHAEEKFLSFILWTYSLVQVDHL